jgi:N4-bis(aminopropyl)spermidine synthase
MAAIMGGLPAPARHLDHVPATAATAARRARFLAESFDLAGASVLCLGDHDLTSLALLHLAPTAEVAVVDVDERVLGHVDAVARDRGWRVRTVFADLRVELPRSLAGRFDLVFSDPPYTPAGVRLFLRRGLEALRRGEFARVLFCYGFGERQPALGLKVQAVVQELRLVAEAIPPAFNRYQGAEAIGGASALYVCRPTRRTWPALRDAAAHADPRIYTHGGGAEEAPLPALPPAAARALEGLAGDRGELGAHRRWRSPAWTPPTRWRGCWPRPGGCGSTRAAAARRRRCWSPSGSRRPPATRSACCCASWSTTATPCSATPGGRR